MPTFPPSGSTLLLRRVLPSLSAPDLFRIKEWHYNPATRTAALYNLPDSTDGTEYDLPTTTIVDRWCDNAGVAPYREYRVFHNGLGGIDTPFFDGVTACQAAPCTLTATLTATATHNGRADLTATAVSANGTVEFSFDGFATPGLPNASTALGNPKAYLLNQRTGRYTVTIRETRPGGCTATATVVVTAPYGPRYTQHFKDANNADCLLSVYEREYTGPTHEVAAQPDAVTLDWPGSAADHVFDGLLRGSQCQLQLLLLTTGELDPLYSGDERLHRVEYTRDGDLIWKGYLLPEQWDVAFLFPPNAFSLAASDGLGALSTVPFRGSAGEALRGDWTFLEIVLHCLGKLELDLPLHVLLNLFPSVATFGTPAIEQIRFDVGSFADEKGKPFDCGKVLLDLLEAFHARLYQENGAWWLERLCELTLEPLTYAAYDPMGGRLSDVTRSLLATVLPPTEGRPCWVDESQRQGLRPAVSTVSVTADAEDAANLLAFATPKYTDLPGPLPAMWTASAPSAGFLVNQGQDKAPLLRLNPGNIVAPGSAPWVQLPPTPLLPIGSNGQGLADIPEGGYVILSFTAKPYGNTPTDVEAAMSTLYVAVNIGGVWVQINGTESPSPIFEPIRFPNGSAVKVSMPFGRLNDPARRRAVTVRFIAATHTVSGTPTTVDISKLSLLFANDAVMPGPEADDQTELLDAYTSTYEGDTGQLVTRTDEALTLFHADTPQVRRQGTPLDLLGRPVQGWQELTVPGLYRKLGDYVVRDRLLWQYLPAQCLGGELLGQLTGPSALFTDPSESRPAVYLQVATTHHAAAAQWTVAGVQLLPLVAPPETLPDNAIYFDDLFAWQAEDGRILVYEDA